MNTPATPALRVSTALADVDIDMVHGFLQRESYWAHGIPRAILQRALAHSLCFSGFAEGRQVAFARVVTDEATFANLLDVFVLPDFRGRGYARELLVAVLADPRLQGLRRFTLMTADAHGLYEQFGFQPLAAAGRMMERHDPRVYTAGSAGG
jgi:ribosomal protein S18 acetylase RimI-like enzyme